MSDKPQALLCWSSVKDSAWTLFACAGPMFQRPVPVRGGEIVERDGFVFADLI